MKEKQYKYESWDDFEPRQKVGIIIAWLFLAALIAIEIFV